jgi:hypothetical protein
MSKHTRNTGIAVLAAAVAGAALAWMIRDQMSRHSRALFSPYFVRRLAALGHMARAEAKVDRINLLKDFVTWETRKSLRKRAEAIILRMEREANDATLAS